MPEDAASASSARIGPNAVTRLAEALHAAGLAPAEVFARAGLDHHLTDPPSALVPEADVAALYSALADTVEPTAACLIAGDAGDRTGRYLLANRIPGLAQAVLRPLPPQPSSFLLLAMIERHLWTFAGSARVEITRRRNPRVRFEDGPLRLMPRAAESLGAFYGATFRRLFRALVAPATEVQVTRPPARGGHERATCLIELSW